MGTVPPRPLFPSGPPQTPLPFSPASPQTPSGPPQPRSPPGSPQAALPFSPTSPQDPSAPLRAPSAPIPPQDPFRPRLPPPPTPPKTPSASPNPPRTPRTPPAPLSPSDPPSDSPQDHSSPSFPPPSPPFSPQTPPDSPRPGSRGPPGPLTALELSALFGGGGVSHLGPRRLRARPGPARPPAPGRPPLRPRLPPPIGRTARPPRSHWLPRPTARLSAAIGPGRRCGEAAYWLREPSVGRSARPRPPPIGCFGIKIEPGGGGGGVASGGGGTGRGRGAWKGRGQRRGRDQRILTAEWAGREGAARHRPGARPGSDAFVGGDFEPTSGAPCCRPRMRTGVPPGLPAKPLITPRC